MATNLSLDPKLIERALGAKRREDQEGRGRTSAGGVHRASQAEVTLMVDTRVWSLAFRRDASEGSGRDWAGCPGAPEVAGRKQTGV